MFLHARIIICLTAVLEVFRNTMRSDVEGELAITVLFLCLLRNVQSPLSRTRDMWPSARG